jgi:hypothetical protein
VGRRARLDGWPFSPVRVWNVLTRPHHVRWLSFSHLARQTKQKVASPSFLCNKATMNSAVWVQYNVPHMWTCGVRITPFFYLKIVVKVFFERSRICINPHVLGSIRVELELNFLKPHQHMAYSTALFQQYFSHSSSA